MDEEMDALVHNVILGSWFLFQVRRMLLVVNGFTK